MRRVRANIVAVEKQEVHIMGVCVCLWLKVPCVKYACAIQSRGLPGYTIISALSHKWHDFRKKEKSY